MASALTLMKHGVRHTDLGMGALGFVLNGGIEFGTGASIGYVYGKHRDSKWGQHAPRIAAVAGKVGSIVANLFAGGGHASRLVAGAFDSVGSAGLAVWGCEVGLEQGRKSAGTQAVLMPASAALPAGATKISKIGELPPAPAGEGLSWQQINELANSH